MTDKTPAQLTSASDVQAADLLLTWRPAGPGPLKSAQASLLKTYILTDLGTAADEDTGTSGHTLGFLDGANTWSAAQAFGTASFVGATVATAAPGTNTTAAASTAFVEAAIAALPASVLPRSYLAGLELSTAGSSTIYGIAAGIAADSTATATLTLGSAYTKTTAAWAVGTAVGSLDTGTIANSTWYHVYLIRRTDTGVTDVIISVNGPSLGPTMPSNYSQSRRIGSMKTNGSAQWVKFVQNGDEFLLDAAVLDYSSTTLGTTSALVTLASVPTGISVEALLNGFSSNGAGGWLTLVSSALQAVQVANSPTGNGQIGLSAVGQNACQLHIRTNTSAQVRAVSTAANTTLYLDTQGWIDTRGRDA